MDFFFCGIGVDGEATEDIVEELAPIRNNDLSLSQIESLTYCLREENAQGFELIVKLLHRHFTFDSVLELQLGILSTK